MAGMRELALARLSVREYGSGEMRTYLIRKGASEADAEAVVSELMAGRLIDDERYARVIARHQAFRDKGPAYVMSRLREKGVNLPMTTIRAIYQEAMPEGLESELELARRVVERRYPRALRDRAEKQRAYQALLRRGFSSEVVRRCLSAGIDEEG